MYPRIVAEFSYCSDIIVWVDRAKKIESMENVGYLFYSYSPLSIYGIVVLSSISYIKQINGLMAEYLVLASWWK